MQIGDVSYYEQPSVLSWRCFRTNKAYDFPTALVRSSMTIYVSSSDHVLKPRAKTKRNKLLREHNVCISHTRDVCADVEILATKYIKGGYIRSVKRLHTLTALHELEWHKILVDGLCLGAISVVSGETHSRLIHILASENVDRKLVGMASVELYNSVIQFYLARCQVVDLGGISSADEAAFNGIDRFKNQFGGAVGTFYIYFGMLSPRRFL
jgi:hypothetical protein